MQNDSGPEGAEGARVSSRPLLLGVETSSPLFSVAVSRGDRLLTFLKSEGTGKPDALLVDLIQRSLAELQLTLSDVEALAISIGPGSFTGLRVGVMTVKTLAWAIRKPILPVSSLEVIAQNLLETQGNLCIFLDARKGKIYAADFFSDGKGKVKRLNKDRLAFPEEVLRSLQEGAILMGDGVRRYSELVHSVGKGKFQLAKEADWFPRADHLLRIAADRWPEGRVDDPHPLVPEYLYSKESDITGW